MVDNDVEFLTGIQVFEKKFIYPNFQRAYSWTEEQISAFLKDILENTKEHDFYLGTIYYIEQSTGEYFIVDGQQRITTLFLYLNAIRILNPDKFLTLDIDFFDIEENPKFDSCTSSPFSKILFSKTLEETEEQIKTETNINLTKMQMYIAQKIIIDLLKDNDKYIKFSEIFLNKLRFLFLDCKDLANSSAIFENINSKGLKLNNTDIIKNAYFARIHEGNDTDFSSRKYTCWVAIEKNIFNGDDFQGVLSDAKYTMNKSQKFKTNLESLFVIYYQLKYKKKFVKTNYTLANEYIKNIELHKKNGDTYLLDELNEIKQFSSVAKYIFNPYEDVPGIELYSMQRTINFLESLGIKVHYPFAIIIYYLIIRKSMYRQNIKQISLLFERIALFHFNYNTMFSSLPSKVEILYTEISYKLYDGEIELETLIDEVETKLLKGKYTFNKNSIIEKLDHTLFTLDRKKEIRKTIDVREIKEYILFDSSSEIKYIYEILERHLRDDLSTGIVIETIEHINNFNDIDFDYRSFKVSNLLPLEDEINEECKNKNVSCKISLYKKSKYKLVKKFVEIYESDADKWYEKWNEYLAELFIDFIRGE